MTIKLLKLIWLSLVLLSINTNAGDFYEPAGIYSNMCLVAESGDILGIEMTVSIVGNEHYVVFQSAEGVVRKPVVSKLTLGGNKIYKTKIYEESGYQGLLVGGFKKDGFYGSFSDGMLDPQGEENFILKKQRSFWQDSSKRECNHRGSAEDQDTQTKNLTRPTHTTSFNSAHH